MNNGPIDISTSHWLPHLGLQEGKYCTLTVSNVKVYMHQLSVAVFHGRDELLKALQSPPDKKNAKVVKFEISHRCHVSQCINPKHLVVEQKGRNLARNACFIRGYCNGEHDGLFCLLDDPLSNEKAIEITRQSSRTGFTFEEREKWLSDNNQSFVSTIPIGLTAAELEQQIATIKNDIAVENSAKMIEDFSKKLNHFMYALARLKSGHDY